MGYTLWPYLLPGVRRVIIWTSNFDMAHAQRVTFSCLQKTTPSNCPLCRRGYNPDRIKRLHVDRPTESPENETARDVTKWLEQIALASAGQSNNDDWMDVARDAQIWLEGRSPDTVCLSSSLSVRDAAIGRVRVQRSRDSCCFLPLRGNCELSGVLYRAPYCLPRRVASSAT